ncbi:protein-L-isoaspartate O-methyltransferase [Lujinxingia sediminis]|uniref:Protein-L-isoaspartate O-methyltransferase n=1 Tax=Lujinxingia sediminis TaxID=2480984 RepID=A0ABY0CXM2_9DELT|nr:protein-L-isoaspartate O-methyltransferase [Lujinxingia sediminis]RVU48449.1 protein-L-isoaspartate O-methyltransferase [Lujinxingia sediminis]
MRATRALCRVVCLSLLTGVGLMGCEPSPAPSSGGNPEETDVTMGTIEPKEDPQAAARQGERERMVEAHVVARGVRDRTVIEAMRAVPRQEFVPAPVRPRAYQDAPLPLGGGRTVLQPYLAALVLELLEVNPDDRVLEVSPGSGYTTALLTEMGARVNVMEGDCEMASLLGDDLVRAGYRGAEVRCGDGLKGWPERDAGFEGVLVHEAVTEPPEALVAQLSPGGRMVVALGEGEEQALTVVMKNEDGMVTLRDVELVQFWRSGEAK